MDVRYINPFLSSIKNVFEKMLRVPYRLGKPEVQGGEGSQYDVSALIGLSGGVTGCVVLCLSESTALALASALAGQRLKEIDADATDAIGEIVNMIAGSAKKDFPGEYSAVSLPTVVCGRHKMSYVRGIPIVKIPCEMDEGGMAVEVVLRLGSRGAALVPA